MLYSALKIIWILTPKIILVSAGTSWVRSFIFRNLCFLSTFFFFEWMRQFWYFFMHYVSIVSHPATIENLWETRLFLVFNYLNLDHAIALHHHQLLSNNLQLAKKIEKWAGFFSFSKWWMKSCYVTVTGFSNETINCRFWCENNDLFENWPEKKFEYYYIILGNSAAKEFLKMF